MFCTILENYLRYGLVLNFLRIRSLQVLSLLDQVDVSRLLCTV